MDIVMMITTVLHANMTEEIVVVIMSRQFIAPIVNVWIQVIMEEMNKDLSILFL